MIIATIRTLLKCCTSIHHRRLTLPSCAVASVLTIGPRNRTGRPIASQQARRHIAGCWPAGGAAAAPTAAELVAACAACRRQARRQHPTAYAPPRHPPSSCAPHHGRRSTRRPAAPRHAGGPPWRPGCGAAGAWIRTPAWPADGPPAQCQPAGNGLSLMRNGEPPRYMMREPHIGSERLASQLACILSRWPKCERRDEHPW